jgi:DHA3 family macrolide efflux protein-like MFS transporter
MLIGGIVLGLLLGLAAGGSVWNLAAVSLRRVLLLVAAVVVRVTTEVAIGGGVGAAETLRLPLFALAYALLLVGLWSNRSRPGLSLAFVGILGNAIAIVANGGHMPMWEPSLEAAGLATADVTSSFHVVLPARLDAGFLLHAGPLADLIPVPFPIIRNVASVGDLFLSFGLAFFLFATVVRSPDESIDEQERQAGPRMRRNAAISFGESRVRRETGPSSLPAAAAGPGPLRPATAPAELASDPRAAFRALDLAPAAAAGTAADIERPAVAPNVGGIAAAARDHPYVRLALNSSFSALWTGQVISLLGDRIHQIALVFLVTYETRSPIAVAAVFIASTLPNLLFSPIAGTFVDRWDQHDVLVVSDLLRAALVLLIPIAALTNLVLVYPLTFLVTSISVFFRPARIAVLPRLVREDELMTANSAGWIAETLADVVGYPLAGVFVAFLGLALPLAFWLDAATYLASAVLVWTIAVPPLARRLGDEVRRTSFGQEFREGWEFLRGETVLLANTLQAAVAQFTLGIVLVLVPVYVTEALHAAVSASPAYYGLLETGIGIGNLVGGFVIGLVGARFARGRTVIVGYAAAGAFIALLGLTNHLLIAFALMTGVGVANMVFVIPSQTLFQERTPAELMGRVVGFRFALVFGSMTLAMAIGGILGSVFGAAPVIGAFGLLTLAAGLAGLLVPAVRDA